MPSDLNLEEIAGHDSDLHRRYKIYLHRVTVATLPEEYEERLSEMASGQFERLRLLVPDPYDYILSKLQRAGLKDSDDALYLFRSRKLQSDNSSRAVSPGIEGLSDRPARTARRDFGALDRNLRIGRLTLLEARRSHMNRCRESPDMVHDEPPISYFAFAERSNTTTLSLSFAVGRSSSGSLLQ